VRAVIRLVAATVLVAAAGTVVQSPAHAAACTSADGVSVVVDFNQLGGGVQRACVPDQGTAADLFVAAGHALEQVQQQPGFVCRVDGLPSDQACVRTPPTNAYWGLWWSDGQSGTWTYATQGAYDLDVPDGGSVAFSWNGSSTRSEPSATPPDHGAEPSPSPSPAGGTGGSGGGAGGTGDGQQPRTGGGSAAPAPGAAPDPETPRDGRDGEGRDSGGGAGASGRAGDRADDGDRPGRGRDDARGRDREREESGATTEASTPAAPEGSAVTSEPAAASQGGLPVWVAPAAAAGLFAVAGGAAYLRRRARAA
jgi:hypothetical protein